MVLLLLLLLVVVLVLDWQCCCYWCCWWCCGVVGGVIGGDGGGENWYKMHRLIIGSRRRITGMAAHDYTQHAKMQNMEMDDCSETVIPNQ